jgi:osmotically-inducible protein OsmY
MLTQAVKKAIAADETISAVPLRIEVRDGEVRLFSDQTNADQRARLAQVAGSVYGVTHVEDNMK